MCFKYVRVQFAFKNKIHISNMLQIFINIRSRIRYPKEKVDPLWSETAFICHVYIYDHAVKRKSM